MDVGFGLGSFQLKAEPEVLVVEDADVGLGVVEEGLDDPSGVY